MCDQKSYEAKPDLKETPKPTLIDELTAVKKKYEDLAKEAKIKETQGAKRKPLPDGTLPLTDEEKKEFKKLVNIAEDEFFERADLVKDHIQIWWRTKHCSWRYDELRSIKAILYLAERFELTSNN